MTDRIKVPAPFQTSARPPIGQPMNPTGAVRRADDIAGAAITLVGSATSWSSKGSFLRGMRVANRAPHS